jgi:hypothetical protein
MRKFRSNEEKLNEYTFFLNSLMFTKKLPNFLKKLKLASKNSEKNKKIF